MVDDTALRSTWAQPIEQMRDQANRMAHIVTELLELSRLEGSGRASTEEIVDVCGLLGLSQKELQDIKGLA